MIDPISTSKQARESLARGLNTLQADPTLPPDLIELAAPVAMAMSSLHQVERSGQLLPHVETALTNLRSALKQLQAAQDAHPAVGATLEPVASALSLVHGLGRLANLPAPAPAAAPAPAPVPAPEPAAAPAPALVAAPEPAPAPAPAPKPEPAPAAAPEPASTNPFAATTPVAAASLPADAPVIAADLGAHSQTNFYKGLAGNDIIDHGGLFVSTYLSPKVGSDVRLRVSLPGGYEFEANAIVRWTRDAGSDAPPGFGAQFTAITPEARQLVYRYVRNREPIFYDDF
jgi:hypothetical protein